MRKEFYYYIKKLIEEEIYLTIDVENRLNTTEYIKGIPFIIKYEFVNYQCIICQLNVYNYYQLKFCNHIQCFEC